MVEETTAATHGLRRETSELIRLIGKFHASPKVAADLPAPRGGRLSDRATRPTLAMAASRASTVRVVAANVNSPVNDEWAAF